MRDTEGRQPGHGGPWADPANPYGEGAGGPAGPYGAGPVGPAGPHGVDPYAAAPYAPPMDGNPVVPGHIVARTPVPSDHPLLGGRRQANIPMEVLAEELGYDPAARNAPVIRRLGAVFVDAAIYGVLLALIMVLLGIFGADDSWAAVAVGALLAGPAGFYAYRAAGDAVFEGSPGKHALGLSTVRANGLPVSGGDGLRRNLWILPSMIPGLGWIASLALMGWIGVTAARDPLGRGGHERDVGTRVTENDPF